MLQPKEPRYAADRKEFEVAATALGKKLLFFDVADERDFQAAFTAAARQNVGMLILHNDPFFNSHRDQLVSLAARYAVPTNHELREFVTLGGLRSAGQARARDNEGETIFDAVDAGDVFRCHAQCRPLPLVGKNPGKRRDSIAHVDVDIIHRDLEAKEKCLAHVVGAKTLRAYDRSDVLEKRRIIMDAWADYCG
jgi:hypothetical protein